jgi:putative intracellular protease/amidase
MVSKGNSYMTVLIAIPPSQFSEMELDPIVKALRDEKIPWEAISSKTGRFVGQIGKAITIKRTFEEVLLKGNWDEIDGIIILGGKGAELHLWTNVYLHELVTRLNEKEKIIGAMGTAPVVLAKAKLLVKKEATVSKGPYVREMMIEDAIVVDKDVFFKDRIITAREHTVADEFMTIFIRYLKGDNPEFQATKAKVGFEF